MGQALKSPIHFGAPELRPACPDCRGFGLIGNLPARAWTYPEMAKLIAAHEVAYCGCDDGKFMERFLIEMNIPVERRGTWVDEADEAKRMRGKGA